MVQVNPRLIALVAGVMAGLLPLIRRYDPMQPASHLLNCVTAGILALSLWNLLPVMHLGINPLSAAVTGWLGAPGIALLAFAKLLTP